MPFLDISFSSSAEAKEKLLAYARYILNEGILFDQRDSKIPLSKRLLQLIVIPLGAELVSD